jgi:hypothetical protein
VIPAYDLRMTVTRVLLAVALLAAAGCGGGAPASPVSPSTVTPVTSTTAPTSSSAAPTSSATGSPAAASPSSTGNEDGFLAALRAGGVPVSATGESERLIGQGICQQIHAGVSPDKLAHDLTGSGYTLAQAATVVSAAQGNFCG